jgi:hypothetical protein
MDSESPNCDYLRGYSPSIVAETDSSGTQGSDREDLGGSLVTNSQRIRHRLLLEYRVAASRPVDSEEPDWEGSAAVSLSPSLISAIPVATVILERDNSDHHQTEASITPGIPIQSTAHHRFPGPANGPTLHLSTLEATSVNASSLPAPFAPYPTRRRTRTSTFSPIPVKTTDLLTTTTDPSPSQSREPDERFNLGALGSTKAEREIDDLTCSEELEGPKEDDLEGTLSEPRTCNLLSDDAAFESLIIPSSQVMWVIT